MGLAVIEPYELPTIPAVVTRGVECPEDASVCRFDLRIMSDTDAVGRSDLLHYNDTDELKNSPGR